MNRDGIRDFAARELGLVTSKYRFAESREEAIAAAAEVGLPCVVKPVMSSSGKGQSTARTAEEVGAAWDYAVANMRGDRPRVIVEEFIDFDSEITLLTVATKDGVLFCPPIGHRQEAGDYRESWQPAAIPREALAVGAVPGAQGGRGAGRPRHLRRRILRPRRPGDLLRAEPAPARHRHGHADLAIPERVRASPARDPRPADPVDRARRPVGLGGHPRRPGERRLSLTRASPRRSRSARRAVRSTCGSSPSRRRSRTAAWASRWRAARTSRMRSSAPRPQPRASAFVMQA